MASAKPTDYFFGSDLFNIHKNIPRTGDPERQCHAEFVQSFNQVILTIAVVTLKTQQPVPIPVAGSNKGIVDTGCCILDQGNNPTPLIGNESVTEHGIESHIRRPCRFHRHELIQIVGI